MNNWFLNYLFPQKQLNNRCSLPAFCNPHNLSMCRVTGLWTFLLLFDICGIYSQGREVPLIAYTVLTVSLSFSLNLHLSGNTAQSCSHSKNSLRGRTLEAVMGSVSGSRTLLYMSQCVYYPYPHFKQLFLFLVCFHFYKGSFLHFIIFPPMRITHRPVPDYSKC